MTSAPAHRAATREDDATDVVPEPAPAPRTRARHRRWILIAVLLLALAAAIAGGVYLWQVATAQAERNAAWDATARGIGAELASTQSDLNDTTIELEVVRGQLAQAQDRISELADEKARLGDEHALSRQHAEYQERVSQAAGTVATALETCIDAQQQLIAAMSSEEELTPELLSEFAVDVDEVCQAAREANEALQDELDS